MTNLLRMNYARIALAACVGLLIVASFVRSAHAITNPDNLQVVSAQCFGGLLETGDFGCITHYDIDYISVPSELASDTFLNNFISSTTPSTLRASSPYVFVNSGYGNGATNIYFSATDAATLGATFSAAHPMQIAGNPSTFPSVPVASRAITWGVSVNGGVAFGNAVLALAADFEVEAEWAGVNLVEATASGNVLTAQGEDYFTNTIPNLRTIAPDIFSSAILTPSFSEREFDRTYSTALETQFDDSALSTTFLGLANFVGAPEMMMRGSIMFVLSLLVWGATARGLSKVPNGLVIAAFTVPVVLGSAVVLGMLDIAVAGVIGFIFLFIIGIYIVKR